MPTYKVTLATEDGEVLESWTVSRDRNDPSDEETLDIRMPLARSCLVDEMSNAIQAREQARR